MLKDLAIWLLSYTLTRISPKNAPSPALLELNSSQSAMIIELQEEISGLTEDYDDLKNEYTFLAQRIQEEGVYVEPTHESLCVKLYELLKEKKILPVTADDIGRAADIDKYEASQITPEKCPEAFITDIKTGKKVKRTDFVYVMKAGHRGRYKIGHGFSPEVRLSTFLTGSPEDLSLTAQWEGGLQLEQLLHARFAAYKWKREWYDLPEEIAQELILELARGTVRIEANEVVGLSTIAAA